MLGVMKYRIFARKSPEIRPRGWPRRWEYNIQMDVTKISSGDQRGLNWLWIVSNLEPSSSVITALVS
jgi:hypothetical protein